MSTEASLLSSVATVAAKGPFPAKEYDITSYFPFLCFPFLLCVPYRSKLHADPESVTFFHTTIWGTDSTRVIYGEIDGIKKSTCCCFSSLETSAGPISPKFGCAGDLVDEIKSELQSRCTARGDTGIIRINEEQLALLRSIDHKLDALALKMESRN